MFHEKIMVSSGKHSALLSFAACFVAIVIVSCTSSPQVPEWVKATPAPDSTYTYFTGSSSAPDSATAMNDATAQIIAGIFKYMGVSINVSSSAEARATMEDYQARITQTVTTESKGKLAGFEVTQKYIARDPKTGLYTVHVLARYETKELTREKARLEALAREKEDAVSRPEKNGDSAAAEGRLLDAIRYYAEAMSAAGQSDIENAQIKLERNAKKAASVAASLRMVPLSESSVSIGMGQTPPPMKVALRSNAGGLEQGVAGAPLRITYPKKLSSGKAGSATLQVFTARDGIAEISLPAFDLPGTHRVYVALDFSSISDILFNVPSWALSYKDAVESELAGTAISFTYKIVSSAAKSPTAIASFVRTPGSGKLTDTQVFSSALKDALLKEGFILTEFLLPPSNTAMDFNSLRPLVPAQAERFIVAALDIGSIVRDGAFYIASVSGSLNIYEMAQGRMLYSASKSAQAPGNSENEAISNALKTLGGKVFAGDLLNSLP